MTVLYSILGLIVVIIVWAIYVRNTIVRLDALVKKTFSDIDIYLKQRFDLIPNLVSTIKGYTKHEEAVFTKVAALRAGYMNAKDINEKINLDKQMGEAIKGINIVVEKYPELKANENYLNLQEELKLIESKISYSRQFYNDTVTTFNAYILIFPRNIVANILGVKSAELFTIEAEQRENVKVEF